MRRDWKEDLTPLILATAAQFAVFRVVDWAKANADASENARRLVEKHFYFAPEILFALIGWLLVKFVRQNLDVKGVELRDWLRASAFALAFGVCILVVAHLDQIFGVLAFLPIGGLRETARLLAKAPVYALFRDVSTLRWIVDLVALVICLLALRRTRPVNEEVVAAKDLLRAGNWIKAGEGYLKVGNLRKAKVAFRKANAPARIAAIELRDGNPKEAAKLFEEAGKAFAWEAAQAWEDAGYDEKASELRMSALSEARATARWDRLAEIGQALGDHAAIAEATRRMAELKEAGPERTALWRKAADATRAAGQPIEAAEAYRAAGEFLLAAECFLAGGRPKDAWQDFERAGDLGRAAYAAQQAGADRQSKEFSARDAEARGNLTGAAEFWRAAGNIERAAALFEKQGLFPRAAATWREAGRLDRAALLYERSGDLVAAAAAWELAGQAERAANLYKQLGDNEKAASLFRGAGKWLDSAAALEVSGQYVEAAAMFHRGNRDFDAARCYLQAGHRERAWEHLVSVPRNEPRVKEFFVRLAEAHMAAGEARDAVHVFRELLGPAPISRENVAWQFMYARALSAAGDSEEAAERLARIAEFDPEYVRQRELAPSTAVAETRRMAHVGSGQLTGFRPHSSPIGQSVPPTPPPGVFNPAAPPTDFSGAFAPTETPEARYEIVAELGRGGMGVVHKALDRKLDRFVALKILPWQALGDETALRYFTREAKVIAALKHPNIVGLYDYGRGWGSLYLAMEFLEGPNLQTLLKADPNRIKKSWRDWFVQAARGVAAAHAKGLLHRDIKPANLMLDEHGTLRILDFGLARPEADSAATSKLIGTPAFFPPEVLRGEAPTPASDVYSLGATFYTLATGRWPYIGDDVLVARLEREPDDPRPYAPFLTEEEIAVLMKSLARHRPERYPDAGDLLGALLSLEAWPSR